MGFYCRDGIKMMKECGMESVLAIGFWKGMNHYQKVRGTQCEGVVPRQTKYEFVEHCQKQGSFVKVHISLCLLGKDKCFQGQSGILHDGE